MRGMMKPSNKKVNKRKISKVTLKNHRKSSHPSHQDEVKEVDVDIGSVRREEIHFHQND